MTWLTTDCGSDSSSSEQRSRTPAAPVGLTGLCHRLQIGARPLKLGDGLNGDYPGGSSSVSRLSYSDVCPTKGRSSSGYLCFAR
jgi:hypothetical protein